ncbi:hypothetical protein FA15DRAFT_611656 [Coprinopsis marcescibilis]|uniref:F-box domain-containing protein n=1 Tax=Coprinopsis marcescibilis TaxID=230819 RepID=A0A5C3L7A2_COPMA|nr:hypothetical protein FA15DRAFT_611656 [Coprinopsis marcescibilis]
MTSGLRVYCHDRWYHVYHVPCNSQPDGLGQWAISEIPRNDGDYEAWLRNLRLKLDRSLQQMKRAYPGKRSTYGNPSFQYHVTRVQPTRNLRIQWIWELDCDHEILHVDSRPFFCLHNVPRDAEFLSAISIDHYGHRAYAANTPKKYLYTQRARPPPVPGFGILYSEKILGITDVSSRTMFALPDNLGTCELVRCAFYETLIGAALRTWKLAYEIPRLNLDPDDLFIPGHLCGHAYRLVELALNPMHFGTFAPKPREPRTTTSTQFWLRDNIFLQLSGWLDQEANRKYAIVSAVESIQNHSTRLSTVYAVLFSLKHILIIRVSSEHGCVRVTQTAPLEFLPSFFATNPTTPGISALMDLSYVVGNVASSEYPLVAFGHISNSIPTEIWSHVASYLTDTRDLGALGQLCLPARAAANDVLKYPHIAGYRLIRPLLHPVESSWVSPRWCRAFQGDYLPRDGMQSLYSRKFEVVHEILHHVTLDLAPGDPPLKSAPSNMWTTSNALCVNEGQINLISAAPTLRSDWAIKYRIVRG